MFYVKNFSFFAFKEMGMLTSRGGGRLRAPLHIIKYIFMPIYFPQRLMIFQSPVATPSPYLSRISFVYATRQLEGTSFPIISRTILIVNVS